MALNPIIKFTTLFGLLAVEIGVSNPGVTRFVGVGAVPGGALLRLPLVLRNEDHEARRRRSASRCRQAKRGTEKPAQDRGFFIGSRGSRA